MGFQLVLKRNSSHDATSCAMDYVKFQSNLKDLPLAITKCPQHPNYDLAKFCLDCEVELCYNCGSKHDGSHKVKYCSLLTMDHDSMKVNIQEQLKTIKTVKIKLHQKSTEIKKKARESKEEIRKGFANLHKIVDMQQNKVLQRLSMQEKDAEKGYKLFSSIYSLHCAQLTSFLNTIEHARLISKKEFYKVSKSLLQHGNNLLCLGKELKSSVPSKQFLETKLLEIPVKQFESICSEIVNLGIYPDAAMCSIVNCPKVVVVDSKTTIIVVVKDKEGYTITNYADKLTVELRHISIRRNIQIDVKELEDGTYELSYTLKFSGDYYLKIKICEVDIPGTPCK